MKRGLCLVLLCLLCIAISGCGKNRKKDEPNNEPPVADTNSGHVNAEVPSVQGEGVIFYRGDTYTEKNMLYYEYHERSELLAAFDSESHQTIPYCFNPACEHRPEKRSLDGTQILEEGCPAYDYTEQSVFICGDHLYFYKDDCLYQADLKGENRKIITRLSKPYTVSMQGNCYYTDEALYVAYKIGYEYTEIETDGGKKEWRAGAALEKCEAGVLCIPFSGEGERVIFHSNEYYDMQVVNLWRHDGCICFQVLGRDCPFSDIQEEAGDDFQAIMNADRRHSFTEAYDYVIETGEIRSFAYEKPSHGGFYFFRDVYGVILDSNKLALYRYSGERIGETEVPFSGIISDQYLIGYNMESSKGVMLNQADGSVVKTSPFSWEDFYLEVVVGDSYYGRVGSSRAYISAEDYWSGKKEGIVPFSEIRVAE